MTPQQAEMAQKLKNQQIKEAQKALMVAAKEMNLRLDNLAKEAGDDKNSLLAQMFCYLFEKGHSMKNYRAIIDKLEGNVTLGLEGLLTEEEKEALEKQKNSKIG